MQTLRRALPTLRTTTLPSPSTTTRLFTSSTPAQIARMTLIGRLAAPPELTTTSTGRELIRYAIGSSSGPTENRHTSWFRIGAFVNEGPFRDFLLRQQKGTMVAVEADSEMRSLDGEGGERRSVLNLRQRDFQVLQKPLNRSAGEEQHASMGEEGDGALAGQG